MRTESRLKLNRNAKIIEQNDKEKKNHMILKKGKETKPRFIRI